MQTDYFADLEDSVAAALREDIGTGDITAELIDANAQASARVITRDKAVICGKPWVNEVFRQVDASLSVQWSIDDGQSANPNDLLFTLLFHGHVSTKHKQLCSFYFRCIYTEYDFLFSVVWLQYYWQIFIRLYTTLQGAYHLHLTALTHFIVLQSG